MTEIAIQQALQTAMAHHQAGRLAQAEDGYRRILQAQPDQLDARQLLGTLYGQVGRLAEAETLLLGVLRVRPSDAFAANNLGNLYLSQRRHAQAEQCYRLALQHAPDYPDAHHNLGNVYNQLGQEEAALQSYLQALALKPDYWHALAAALDQAQLLCDWPLVERLWPAFSAALAGGALGFQPFQMLALPTTAAQQRANAVAYAQRFPSAPPLLRADTGGRERLRIGYLSGDFQDHATAYLISEVFELHDRARVTVEAFSYGAADGGAYRRRIVDACDRFHDLHGVDSRTAARVIAKRRLDVLIDLKGHTEGTRLDILCHRPARLQLHWLGYPGTLGMAAVDGFIGDAVTLPPGCEAEFTERLLRLPHCYQPQDRRRRLGPPPGRAALGLPERGRVLASFNQPYKITAEVFAIWLRLLAAHADTVLWLWAPKPAVQARLRAAVAAAGLAPQRLVLAESLPQAAHLARLQHADLLLDTLPVNAHTTASDALFAGCPVLTCRGQTFAGRVAASLLMAAGLPELVTPSLAEYEAQAHALLADAAALPALRQRLEAARTTAPLWDTPALVRALEDQLLAGTPR